MSDPYYDTPELPPSGMVFELDSENCFEEAGTLDDYTPLDDSFHHSFGDSGDASIPTGTYSRFKQPYMHSYSTSTDMNLEQQTNASTPISPLSSYRDGTNSLRTPSELGSIQFSTPEQSLSSPTHRCKSTSYGPAQAKGLHRFSDVSQSTTTYTSNHIFSSSSARNTNDLTGEGYNHISPPVYGSAFVSSHQPYNTSHVHSTSLQSIESTHRGFGSHTNNATLIHEDYHARPTRSPDLIQFGSHLMGENPHSQLPINHISGYPSGVEADSARIQLHNNPYHFAAAQPNSPPTELGAISCRYCHTKFTGKYARGNRGRHIRCIHGNQKSMAGLTCQFCKQKFRRSDAARKHEREKHGLDSRSGSLKSSGQDKRESL